PTDIPRRQRRATLRRSSSDRRRPSASNTRKSLPPPAIFTKRVGRATGTSLERLSLRLRGGRALVARLVDRAHGVDVPMPRLRGGGVVGRVGGERGGRARGRRAVLRAEDGVAGEVRRRDGIPDEPDERRFRERVEARRGRRREDVPVEDRALLGRRSL